MLSPKVAVISIWRNDVERSIANRVFHLLNKTYRPIRFIWVVGDSDDATEEFLRVIARSHQDIDIRVIRHDTGIVGDDPDTRLKRMSRTADAGFSDVKYGDGYVLLHESDLQTPPDIIGRFLATGKCPVAGWPTLGSAFYDSYAYRKNGRMFSNHPPYHECYKPDEPFEVDGFGSCWLAYAGDFVEGVRGLDTGVINVCNALRARGRQLWVDPTIPVIQPTELWVSMGHAKA